MAKRLYCAQTDDFGITCVTPFAEGEPDPSSEVAEYAVLYPEVIYFEVERLSAEEQFADYDGDRPEWKPLVTIDYAENPSFQGTVYRLRHHELDQAALVMLRDLLGMVARPGSAQEVRRG